MGQLGSWDITWHLCEMQAARVAALMCCATTAGPVLTSHPAWTPGLLLVQSHQGGPVMAEMGQVVTSGM